MLESLVEWMEDNTDLMDAEIELKLNLIYSYQSPTTCPYRFKDELIYLLGIEDNEQTSLPLLLWADNRQLSPINVQTVTRVATQSEIEMLLNAGLDPFMFDF